MNNLIKVNWYTENPKEENDYIVTVLEPLMFGSDGGSSYVKALEIAHYDPDDGWNRHVIAWTDTWIDIYDRKDESL